jgi:hypothetical protein
MILILGFMTYHLLGCGLLEHLLSSGLSCCSALLCSKGFATIFKVDGSGFI